MWGGRWWVAETSGRRLVDANSAHPRIHRCAMSGKANKAKIEARRGGRVEGKEGEVVEGDDR